MFMVKSQLLGLILEEINSFSIVYFVKITINIINNICITFLINFLLTNSKVTTENRFALKKVRPKII
jgi:hypothetical protein